MDERVVLALGSTRDSEVIELRGSRSVGSNSRNLADTVCRIDRDDKDPEENAPIV